MSGPDFDGLYATEHDPFQVGSRWYEQRKIAVLLAALRHPSYGLIWDCASGTGHLAQRLLERGDVIASDASQAAVQLTAERIGSSRATHAVLPEVPPQAAPCDLIVLSEVLYYLDGSARREVYAAVQSTSATEIVAVHWSSAPDDGTASGHDVSVELHDALSTAGWSVSVVHLDEEFELRSWSREAVQA